MYLLDIRHFIFIIQVRFVFMLCDEITETRIFCNINIYYNINFLTFLKFDVPLLDFSSYQGAKNVKAEEGIVALSETVIIICWLKLLIIKIKLSSLLTN